MEAYMVTTLQKGLHLIDLIRVNESMTLTELMRASGYNKTTTFRLLYTLEQLNYVEKTEDGYRLGDKLESVEAPIDTVTNWYTVPPLQQLSEETGETVYVAILHGTNVVNTQVVDGTHSIRSHTEVGERSPAHQSALGKAILAFLDESSLQRVMTELELVQKTAHTFVDRQLLTYHLRAIHEQGYAVDDEEAEIGLRCIAVPIMRDGHVIAALAISGPSSRLTKKRDRQLSKVLQQYSQAITSFIQ
ncbi:MULTISPECIES: IclR family transcriptional regulator [unclassified Exiguobacterium]|jgi:IclR family KDG regulon transcriptional repressor|uniref:IclR family transcriptional regulator n=1 Tax=unclassified Exiguobacterium TaxID=2644629 RepID=UPI001BEBE809|nr:MULTISPECIES: IclR family transcriptional regulator [unclassified Exiguobacterium]